RQPKILPDPFEIRAKPLVQPGPERGQDVGGGACDRRRVQVRILSSKLSSDQVPIGRNLRPSLSPPDKGWKFGPGASGERMELPASPWRTPGPVGCSARRTRHRGLSAEG